jgi:GNAT superfamily N-acetyltransferase
VLRGTAVAVREALDSDLPALSALRRVPAPRDGGHNRLPEDPLDGPGLKVFVAEVGGEVVGMVAVGREPVGPVGVAALEIAELHVRNGFEHRGVGSALVAVATTQAEEMGCQHVLLTLPPTVGESAPTQQRAGLFGAGRRLAPVSVLRRRLGLEPASPASLAARRRAVLRRVVTVRHAAARRG